MLSETASIHLRLTMRPDAEMPSVSKMAMSLRPERAAQHVVLAVERIEGELVPQAGLGGDDRLLVQVDVVSVGVRRLERARGRGAVERRGFPAAEGALQRGLEVHAAGQEAGSLDVGDVVRGDPLALRQPGEGGVQCSRGGVADHGTGRRRMQQDTIDLRVCGRHSRASAGSADPWRSGAVRALRSSAPGRPGVTVRPAREGRPGRTGSPGRMWPAVTSPCPGPTGAGELAASVHDRAAGRCGTARTHKRPATGRAGNGARGRGRETSVYSALSMKEATGRLGA